MKLATLIIKRFSIFLAVMLVSTHAFAAPSNTMSITPSATAGQTITASDENARNNEVSTKYNAHDHSDVDDTTANTFTIGDAAAGNKTFAVNDDQAASPAVRFNTTTDRWTVSNDGSTYDTIGLSSGSVIAGENDFRIGDNLGSANKRLIANENTTDGELRWNVTSDQWQVSNNASTFYAIGSLSGAMTISGVNTFDIGDGTDRTVFIRANNGDSNLPFVRYNHQYNRWENSNDGTTVIPLVSSAVGTFTRDISLATDQTVTGVGFKPRSITFIGFVDGTSYYSSGFDNDTSGGAAVGYNSTGPAWAGTATKSIYFRQAGNIAEANVISFNPDGFTLDWTLSASPTGTATILYRADP